MRCSPALGFEAWLVEARTRDDGGQLGPHFDHARILVAGDDETLLVDVGTGVSPRGPLRLVEQPQQVGSTRYRVRGDGQRYHSEVAQGHAWKSGWSFDTTPRRLDDFAERCAFHQHSPESHFTRKPIATLVTVDSHVTLADRALITVRDGHRHEEQVDEPLAVLADIFGIVLPRWPGS